MFKYKVHKLNNNLGLPIGLKIDLSGDLSYGSSTDDLAKFRQICGYIETQSISESIVVDLTRLEEWHSVAIKCIIPLAIKINKAHPKRTPVSFIGLKDKDVFWAVQEKHQDSLDSNLIPWFESFDDFSKKNSHLNIKTVSETDVTF